MNKKMLLFMLVPFLGFIVFLSIHFYLLNDINNLILKQEQLRVRQDISMELNQEVIKIKSLLFQIPVFSRDKNSLSYNVKILKKELSKIENLLFIMKNGGVYKKKLPLNIVHKNNYEQKYILKKGILSLEAIELYPQINKLKEYSSSVEKLIYNFIILRKNKDFSLEKFDTIKRSMIFLNKSIDSVARRAIENSNRLFYETRLELLNFKEQLDKKTTKYKTIEFSIIISLVFLFVIVGYLIFKELTSLNEALKNRLYKDKLTKVSSRAKLEEVKFEKNSVLILVDIDDFSMINELYDTKVGDVVLKNIANRLKLLKKDTEIFRVSADVFAIYNKNHLQEIEQNIINLKSDLTIKPIEFEENSIDIEVTMGIAFGKKALHDAFVALNMAKNEKITYKIFHSNQEFREIVEFNKKWQKEIKYALMEDRVEPFFQPIVDRQKNIVKYEALMRIKKIENGKVKYIEPFFIDIAIKTKQYITLSQNMIEKTFKVFKDNGSFSINLNYIDIKNSYTKEFLLNLIKKYNAYDKVTFEILESESMKDYELVSNFLNSFKEIGIKIAIDDFGSGYSNLKRIVDLNSDFIKIDGSLIKEINRDFKSYSIVKSIVLFAKEIDNKTVAEYVHSKEIFDICYELGIDCFQGYYISKPKRLDDMEH